jgi:GT2 family glycosyltransferase
MPQADRPDLDTASLSGRAAEGERIAQITRLYLVVHGRPPDPAGLAAFVAHLRDGRTLRDLAAEFVASGEFIDRVGGGDAAALLRRHAWGDEAAEAPAISPGSLGDLAAGLVLSAATQERFAVLPALYPHGVPLDSPVDYRIWLSQQPAPPRGGGPSPVLSFVTILDRPVIPWLKAAITSVLAQPGPHEMLMVGRRFPRFVRRIAGDNPRLRLLQAPLWRGQAASFNRALMVCTGEFVALIGPHDRLDETAIAGLGDAVRTADIVIADDDAMDDAGLRHSPRLGTAWDPDRVLASGCPGLILLRTALVRRLRGMRSSGGAEEWDLLLRAAAAAAPAGVVHVPRILLSRRAARSAAPPLRIARRHVAAALPRGCTVSAEEGPLRIVHPLPKHPPGVSIVIPTRDRAELLRTCTEGLLRRTDYPRIELIIVDNGSTAPDALTLLAALAKDPRVRVLQAPGPFNWSALNNAGVAAMRGEIVVLLNNDIDVIDPSWLRELVSQALRPEVGIVGAKLLYPNGTIQHAGIVLGPAGRATHMWRHSPGAARGYLDVLSSVRQASAMTGACLALRRDVYDAAGGCEQAHLPITWNDVDLCLRIRGMGLRAIWTPHARLLHLEQASRGTDETVEHQRRYRRELAWMRARWDGALDHDPFLSPHLRPSEDWRETAPRLMTDRSEFARCAHGAPGEDFGATDATPTL